MRIVCRVEPNERVKKINRNFLTGVRQSERQINGKRDRNSDMRADETIHQTIAADLYAYWNRIRGAHAAPTRADIQPNDIAHILPDAFMIDMDPAEGFPLRLCGARLNALWLKRQKGSAFLDFWRTDVRRNIAASLFTVIDAATPFAGVARAQAASHLDIEMALLLLPLRKTGLSPARVFGVLSPNYQPAWFGEIRAEPLDLVSLHVFSPQTFRIELYKESGFQHMTPPPSRPRFVVYEGGKR